MASAQEKLLRTKIEENNRLYADLKSMQFLLKEYVELFHVVQQECIEWQSRFAALGL